jgi:serine protease Do
MKIASIAIAASLALVGCTASASGARPVDFKHVDSATVRILIEGDFVPVGTTDAVREGFWGSGFIFDQSGLVMTNNHVVSGAEKITVDVGGRKVGAKILGLSECLDLAVLQLDGNATYPFLGFHQGAIDRTLKVYSVGYPGGDPTLTITDGIVNKTDFAKNFNWAVLDNVVEHSARIRGGNSGGPLVDAQGLIVGVNDGVNAADDYNWAIHRDVVLKVIHQLIAGDAVNSLGLNLEARQNSDDGSSNGIWISSVTKGSVADKAGVLAGDVLLTMDGTVMAQDATLGDYCSILKKQGTDAKLDFTILRPSDGKVYEGEFNGAPVSAVAGGTGDTGGTVGSFVTITDDPGVIEVSVPDTWTDTSKSPFKNDAGNTVYQLVAAPNVDTYLNSFTVPGIDIKVSTDDVGQDIDAALADKTAVFAKYCTAGDPTDYSDGYYIGKYIYFSNCDNTTTDVVSIVAVNADKTHILYLNTLLVSDVDKSDVLKQIINSFKAKTE